MSELIRIYPNDNLSVNIDNLTDTNTDDFAEFTFTLQKEGEVLETKTFDISIEPYKNYWYFFEPGNLYNGEYIYTFSAKTTKAFEGLKKGTLLAKCQKVFTIDDNPKEEEEKEYKAIQVDDTESTITFVGEDFTVSFEKGIGGLIKLDYDGVNYINSKPQVTFWRPLTDTDLRLGLQYENGLWLGATVGQQILPEKYWFEQLGDSYQVTFVYRYPLPGGQESAVIYTVHPSGTIDVQTTYSGLATMDYLPTFGMNFTLNKDLDAIRYYGYGPDENYIDTTEGLDLGVYQTTVRKNFKKNKRPQETGNRTGVRWAEVYNNKTGRGLKFTALQGPFEFNALPYNDLEIEAAATLNDLPKVTKTSVRIAGKVAGVGNGEYLEDWAKIDAGEMIELKFSISPVHVDIEPSKSKSAAQTPKKINQKSTAKKEPEESKAKTEKSAGKVEEKK